MSPRAFCKVFWMTTAGALAMIAALNLLLDPRGYYDTGFVKPYYTSTHISRALVARNDTTPPDLLVLGSSRVEPLDCTYVRHSFRWTTLNGGVQGGQPADALAMYRFLVDTLGPPRNVLIALDIEMLQDSHASFTTRYPSPLWPYYPSSIASRLTMEEFIHPILQLVSLDQTIDSFRLIRRELFPQWQPPFQDITLDDGTVVFPIAERKITVGNYDFEQNVDNRVQAFRDEYAYQAELSPQNKADLEALLDLAHSYDNGIYIFLPPYHPTVLQVLCERPEFRAAYVTTREYLAQLQSTYGFVFRDLTDVTPISTDLKAWYDGDHFRPILSSAILETIFDGAHLSVAETEPISCVETTQQTTAYHLLAGE